MLASAQGHPRRRPHRMAGADAVGAQAGPGVELGIHCSPASRRPLPTDPRAGRERRRAGRGGQGGVSAGNPVPAGRPRRGIGSGAGGAEAGPGPGLGSGARESVPDDLLVADAGAAGVLALAGGAAARRPEALAVLVYYALLLHYGRSLWQVGDAGAYMLRVIAEHLGPEWDAWLEYPRERMAGDCWIGSLMDIL